MNKFGVSVIAIVIVACCIFQYNSRVEINKLTAENEKLSEQVSADSETIESYKKIIDLAENGEVTLHAGDLDYTVTSADLEGNGDELADKNADGNAASVFNDGTYQGHGQGFGGDITVQVTIKSDVIESVEIVSAAGEDQAYLSMAESIPGSIVAAQSTSVDTVSGATFTSVGIINATTDALSQAVR